jgi:hypothetical protein
MLDAEPGWRLVRDRGFLALIKRFTGPRSAEQLRAGIIAHIAGQAHPELAGRSGNSDSGEDVRTRS